MASGPFDPLLQFIYDNNENMNEMREIADNEENKDKKAELLYQIYANFVDLEKEIKGINKGLRIKYGIKDSVVKDRMKSEKENKEEIDD